LLIRVIHFRHASTTKSHQKCLEAGASDYMAKPIDVEKLLSLLRVWMFKQ
jgi:CheY-like chemotaxis protein